jgi:hypothetical protein
MGLGSHNDSPLTARIHGIVVLQHICQTDGTNGTNYCLQWGKIQVHAIQMACYRHDKTPEFCCFRTMIANNIRF